MTHDPQWSDATETLSFRVTIDGKRHVARISAEALEDHFGAGRDPGTHVTAYRANSDVIDQKAIERIKAGVEEPVLLRKGDF